MFGYRCLILVVWLAVLPVIGVSQTRPSPSEPSLGDLDRELSMEPAFRNPQAVLAEVIRRRGGASPRLPVLRPQAIGGGMTTSTGTGGGNAGGSTSGFSYEVDTIRWGSDYRNFGLPAAQAELCRDACAGDPSCKAYSYIKPGAGTHGSSPWCYLKNAVPPAVRNTCCLGGVKSANPTRTGSGSPKVLRDLGQEEHRDASGRVTQEAATIHIVACNGSDVNSPQVYIYEYLNRPAFRAIAPPDFAHPLGGRDFGTFNEALTAACGR